VKIVPGITGRSTLFLHRRLEHEPPLVPGIKYKFGAKAKIRKNSNNS
jgi:hypothetical protein